MAMHFSAFRELASKRSPHLPSPLHPLLVPCARSSFNDSSHLVCNRKSMTASFFGYPCPLRSLDAPRNTVSAKISSTNDSTTGTTLDYRGSIEFCWKQTRIVENSSLRVSSGKHRDECFACSLKRPPEATHAIIFHRRVIERPTKVVDRSPIVDKIQKRSLKQRSFCIHREDSLVPYVYNGCVVYNHPLHFFLVPFPEGRHRIEHQSPTHNLRAHYC